MALFSNRLEKIIAARPGNGTPHRFQIQTPAAAGAGIKEQLWIALFERVPIREVTGHILNLGQTLAVWFVMRAPVIKWVNIKILAVEIDALSFNNIIDVIDQPLPRCRIAQIKKPPVRAVC